MDACDFKVIKEEKHDDDVVMVINDWYSNSDMCDYVLPVSETPVLDYSIVKESEVSDKDKYHEVSYAL
jgi:hypothetical protein